MAVKATPMTLPLAIKYLHYFRFPRYLYTRRNNYLARQRKVLTRNEHNTIPFFRGLSTYVQNRLTR